MYSLCKKNSECDNEEEFVTSSQTVAELVHRSHRHYDNTMYINLYGKHFSYISDINKVCKSFCCSKCDRLWKHVGMLHRHERTCEANVKYIFPGGAYSLPQTIFEQLADEGIDVPDDLKFFPHRATFDFECYFENLSAEYHGNTDKLHWEQKHVPLSVSVCSNVPDHTEPKCFVSNGDPHQLIADMMQHLVRISKTSYQILLEEFEDVFSQIDERLSQEVDERESGNCENVGSDDDDDEMLSDNDDDDDDEIMNDTNECKSDEIEIKTVSGDSEDETGGSSKTSKTRKHPLELLKEKLDSYLKELPVLGFNSGKYDINAIKEFLIPYLVKHEPVLFTVKKNNNHMCIKTEHLKFLDITNYLAPNFSYADFLKAYEIEQTKGFFPYQWMDSLDKLNETSLPPHEAFFSSLRNTNISAEEYRYCHQVWAENNMTTFKDFLVWYNNLDVEPFLAAAEKTFLFWQERNIDMFVCQD